MLCKYKYRTSLAGTKGEYQADSEDAKKCFQHLRKTEPTLQWFSVELADGRFYYWDKKFHWQSGEQLKQFCNVFGRNSIHRQRNKYIKER